MKNWWKRKRTVVGSAAVAVALSAASISHAADISPYYLFDGDSSTAVQIPDVEARELALGISTLTLSAGVSAAILLETSFAENFPFGPFLPTEPIEIVVTLKNSSADQTLTICEGPCLGDSNTFSLGGLASIPTGYIFFFGDEQEEAVFDGQIAGTLLAGDEKDFIFGIYTPLGAVTPGMYPFSAQLQIFAATADRPMLASPTFSGNWEVQCSPFPGGGSTGGCFPGPGPFPAPEPSVIALVAAGLIALGLLSRRRLYAPARERRLS